MPDQRRADYHKASLTKETIPKLSQLSVSDHRRYQLRDRPAERLAAGHQSPPGASAPFKSPKSPYRPLRGSEIVPDHQLPRTRPSHSRSTPQGNHKMNDPQHVSDELQQLLQPDETPRPKGRRHRRHEKETYGSYPAIVNQSFAFQPPTTPATAYPVARRARVLTQRPEVVASRPVSTIATVGSRPSSVVSQQAPIVAEVPATTTTQPAIALAMPSANLPVPPTVPAKVSPPPVVMVYPVRETIQGPSTKTVKVVEPKHPPPKQPAKPVPHAIIDEYEDDIACPICMNVMVGPCLLSPCGHALCGPCIVPWLETRASTGEQINCPVCRERVSKRHPLVQSRTLEGMIKRWVDHKLVAGEWEGHEDWQERSETWKIHKQYNPELVSPELFARRAATQDRESGQFVLVEPDTNRLERVLTPPTELFGALPFMRSTLLDNFFPDHRTSYLDRTGPFAGPSFDPFQHLSEMGARFDAVRNSIIQDMVRSRQQ